MRLFELTALGSALVLTAGCATTTQHAPTPTAPALNYDEASAFARGLKSAGLAPVSRPTPTHFIQPINKKEDCRLPTTQDQIDRQNFRAYWDGGCKNGYAFGLGRDIAISDTHHTEEITYHNGTGNNIDSLSVLYDFVNTTVRYNAPAGNFPAASWMNENIRSSDSTFFVSFTTGITDESGNSSVFMNSPLQPTRLFVSDRRNVVYRFTDNSSVPAVDPSAVSFFAETLDPKTQLPGGVVIVRHANGLVRHLRLTGSTPEAVTLPAEYVSELTGTLMSTRDALTGAQSNIERARQMEREYLYLACNGKHTIDGLETGMATKICNWRSQFKAPYEKSLAKYTSDMESLRLRAESAAQQRLGQQQAVTQQRQLQQQQSQLEIQQLANSLSQFGQQMQSSSQQMLNNAMNQPSPQVNFAPFKPLGNNAVRCVTVGAVTNCR